MPTPAESIRTYIRAKDGNRPHLMALAFAEAAEVAIVAPAGTIAFPPLTCGRDAITEILVRRFAQAYENVYTFCLSDPPEGDAGRFSCDWLVGMSEKAGGAVRVGCGRYDWAFRADHPHLVERLTIAIERMETLSPAGLDPVMGWLSRLPWPWCPADAAVQAAPKIEGLAVVVERIARGTA